MEKLKHGLSHIKFSYTDSLTDRQVGDVGGDDYDDEKKQKGHPDYYQLLMKKLRALRDLNSYTLRDIMKQVGGYQFNIFQISGQGIILDDEVFLAIPSG
jgi:hypothetical protein